MPPKYPEAKSKQNLRGNKTNSNREEFPPTKLESPSPMKESNDL